MAYDKDKDATLWSITSQDGELELFVASYNGGPAKVGMLRHGEKRTFPVNRMGASEFQWLCEHEQQIVSVMLGHEERRE